MVSLRFVLIVKGRLVYLFALAQAIVEFSIPLSGGWVRVCGRVGGWVGVCVWVGGW